MKTTCNLCHGRQFEEIRVPDRSGRSGRQTLTITVPCEQCLGKGFVTEADHLRYLRNMGCGPFRDDPRACERDLNVQAHA